MSYINLYKSIEQSSNIGTVQGFNIRDAFPQIKQTGEAMENLTIFGTNYVVPSRTFSFIDVPDILYFGFVGLLPNIYCPYFTEQGQENFITHRFKGSGLYLVGSCIRQYSSVTSQFGIMKDNFFINTQVNLSDYFYNLGGRVQTYPIDENIKCCILYDSHYVGVIYLRESQKANVIKLYALDELLELDFELFDENYGYTSSAGGYGGGSFDSSSDKISIPSLPQIGVSNSGFINVYRPNQNALQRLGEDIFPDFEKPTFKADGDITDIVYNLEQIGKSLGNMVDSFINSKLIDYVIDCHVVPCNPTVTDSEAIKIGFKTFPQVAPKVTQDYVRVDCGTINIKEYYENFIDYVGTSAKLYLPFIGYVPIENEYFQNGTLGVEYIFNVIDGSFMCFVKSTSSKSQLNDSVIAEYGGNCCVHIPITGLNYSTMVSGVLSGTSASLGNALDGNVFGSIESSLNTLSAKPQMQSSNSYNSTSSFLGIRIPYLVISRQVSSFSEKYREEKGLPLNVSKKLNDVKGFTICENLIVGFECLNEEKEEIKELFAEGVYL